MTPLDSVTPAATRPLSTAADTIAVSRLSAADSLRLKAKADSLRAATLTEGIVIESPSLPEAPLRHEPLISGSWVAAGLLLIFCIVSIRFKNNGRYLSTLFQELFEVRERHNVFDDTVRETSMLMLLNLQWCLSAGVCLYYAVELGARYLVLPGVPHFIPDPLQAPVLMLLCGGVALSYTLLMSAAYYVIGNVFTDSRQALMWLRGFLACQGLMSIPFLVVALLLLSMPAWTGGLLIACATTLIIAKIMFVWKGFRIFFTRISSWVLFLYYLCSLEIIPLILTFVAATAICASVP